MSRQTYKIIAIILLVISIIGVVSFIGGIKLFETTRKRCYKKPWLNLAKFDTIKKKREGKYGR